MREIKYRGKDIETGEWVYGSLFQALEQYPAIAKPKPTADGKLFYCLTVVNPDTVGQYTGLKDRNGKEIYEGDIIVQQGYSGMRPMLVQFESGAFVTGSHKGSSTPKRPMLIQPRCKMIGNIHDNPELLEEEK